VFCLTDTIHYMVVVLLVSGCPVDRNLRLYIVLIGATNRTGLFGAN